MAEKARMRRGWMVIRVEIKIRFRVSGSCWRWFWLAMIMRGSSQQHSTSRGDDVWSMPAHCVRFLWG